MRKLLSILLGVLLVVAAVFIAKNLIANKKTPKPKYEKIRLVYHKKISWNICLYDRCCYEYFNDF